MSDFLTAPGFFGTKATLRSDLTLVLIVASAVMFNIGFVLARRKHFKIHRWVQTSAVVLNSAVVLISMVTSYIIHILPGIPAKLAQGDYAVTTVHAMIGASAFLFGIFVVLQGNNLMPRKLRIKKYKPYMRWAYSLYMVSTISGIILYVIVFIFGL